MPVTSHDVIKEPRRELIREAVADQTKKRTYNGFQDVSQMIDKSTSLDNITITKSEDCITLEKYISPYVTPYLEVLIDDGLAYTVAVHGWYLPNNHDIYMNNVRPLFHLTVSNLITSLLSLKLCPGVSGGDTTCKKHIMPMKLVPDSENSDSETKVEVIFDQTVYNRSKDCRILIDSDEIRCENCAETQVIVSKCTKQKQTHFTTPAKPKGPVSKTIPNRIKLTLEQQRLECAQLQARIEEMKSEIERSSKVVDNELSNDLISIMEKKVKM